MKTTPRPKFNRPPDSLNTQKLQDYPGHQRFKQEGKSGVIAFMGQLYSETGRKLAHDPQVLAQGNFTMMPEMANIILQKVEKETKTCHSCGYTRLMSNAKFCSTCGAEQKTATVVASDDKLVQMLKSLNPDNPFHLANTMQPRDSRAPSPEDFMTREDVQRIIEDAFEGRTSFEGVPGEGPVQAKPNITTNPYAKVNYEAR